MKTRSARCNRTRRCGHAPTSNARKKNPLKVDPTRTGLVRKKFATRVSRQFARLKLDLYDLLVREDALGLKPTLNFAPVPVVHFDPDQARDSDGRFTGGGGRAQAAVEFFKAAPRRLVAKVKAQVAAKYTKLERRYGPRYAKAIIGAALLGIPVPAPGASFAAAAPVIVVAELHRLISGGPARNYDAPDPVNTGEMSHEEVLAAARELVREIYEAFNLEPPPFALGGPVANQRWRGMNDPAKLKAFQDWLKSRFQEQLASSGEKDVWEAYIRDGFAKGAGRAFQDTRGLPPEKGERLGFYRGSREEFLRSAFNRPESADKAKLLASRTLDELNNVTQDMATKMTRVLTDGLVQGRGPREVAADLADEVDVGRDRALTIARTEFIRAHAEGQLTAMELLGVEEVGAAIEWSTAGDEAVCPLCEPLEGVVLKIDEARGMLPRHPNAVFAGSTFVSYGECEEIVRAWYRGPAIIFTVDGGKHGTTIGPNHPVMTRRGMVAAAKLCKGDEVLYDLRGNLSPHGIDHKKIPTIEDVFESSILILGHTRVVASASDLHGDRVFCQGEVEGIRPTGNLLRVRNSGGVEELRQDEFTRTDTQLSFVPGNGPSDLSFKRIGPPSPGRVGGRNLPRPLITSHTGPLQLLSLALCSLTNTVQGQAPVNGSGRRPKGTGYRRSRFTGKVTTHDFFVWKRVHSVSPTTYEGWAFDATTATSLYCSDSFVVSNCRCAWLPANVGEAADDGRKDTKSSIQSSIKQSARAGGDADEWGPGEPISKSRPKDVTRNADWAEEFLSTINPPPEGK